MPFSCHSCVFFGLVFVAQICSAYYPAPGSAEYSNSICTSLDSPLCTRNGSRDPCFRKATTKATEECLQHAVEAYYGPALTRKCSNLAFLLTTNECAGCPWDTLNVTAFTNSEKRSLPLPKALFHRARVSCSIANHVQKYIDPLAQFVGGYALPLTAGLLMVALSGLVSEFTGENIVSKRVRMFGTAVPEWVHLTLLWFLLLVIVVMLSFSEDFFLICESQVSFLTQFQLRTVSQAVTHAYSFSRCLRLPSHKEDPTACDDAPSSWYTCALRREKQKSWVFLLSVFCVFISRLILLFFFFWDDIFSGLVLVEVTTCDIFYMNYLYALNRFGKYAVLMFAVAVYSVGPQTNRTSFLIRFITLFVLMCCSIIFLILSARRSHGRAHFFPGMQVYGLMFRRLEEVHAIFVCLLGLLEPCRLGVPPSRGTVESDLSLQENNAAGV